MFIILTVGALLSMIIFPETTVDSAVRAINLWIGSVLPALLPFFICVNMLNRLGFSDYLPPKLYGFTMSCLSGYPVGAKIINDYYLEGMVDRNYCKWMISFCSTSGPAFMMGVVGVNLLGSGRQGMIIAVSHYLAAVLNGFIFNILIPHKTLNKSFVSHKEINKKRDGTIKNLSDSIFSSLKSMGMILGYIILFMFITDMASSLLHMFNDFSFGDFPLGHLCSGMLEMTVGCSAVTSDSALSSVAKTIMCSFFISFGGFSIIGQTCSIAPDVAPEPFYVVIVKLSHGLISLLLTFIITNVVLL